MKTTCSCHEGLANVAETALLSEETDETGRARRMPVPSISSSENLTSQAASDGDDQGAVLKTLKSRKATSAFDTPSQVVIAAYNHEDMLDTNDEPHEHMPDRLPVEIPGESATPAVYVGILWVAIQHVFMRDKTKVNKVSFADNTESFDLRAEPSNVVAGINTVFHEDYTVPGNISRLKRFVKDKATVFEEKPAPMTRLLRQNNRVLQYLPVEPLQNLEVSDDAGHQPSHRTLYHRNGIDTHWMYHATPLGVVEPPKKLIDRLNVFLSIHPLDSIPTNAAVHVKLEDLVYDKEQMVFKWDGMIREVMNAMAEGSLPNEGDIESLTTNGATTQETTVGPQEPPVPADEPIDYKN
ncbi:hypothetical protein FAGAP_8724 [Fusarium agapanthi]|uniref:Uncharacterized protein n=1 Tax=Fusarium agapanthi TaxID=1803897 RepID=A0A9P5EC08_9HYPO|nr:hypothetical protein FAGAP_8724 [Fusarium agapanthi]